MQYSNNTKQESILSSLPTNNSFSGIDYRQFSTNMLKDTFKPSLSKTYFGNSNFSVGGHEKATFIGRFGYKNAQF